jgi:hypothetical protein
MMADANECFTKMETLYREVFTSGPSPTPPLGFSGRVMALVREKAERQYAQRYFLRVARSIVLAGTGLAGVLALVMMRGYAEFNLVSLTEVMTHTTSMHILSL